MAADRSVLSPGYYSAGEGWIFTGCKAHDKDPCSKCDVE